MLHDGTRTWTDPQVTSIGRLPMTTPLVPFPTAAAADPDDAAASPWWRSLDGSWQFHLAHRPDLVPAGFEAPSFDDSGWEQVEVPGAWTTQALEHEDRTTWFDLPHYTNVQMPFDCEPPAVPEENPTGAYRTSFTVPRDWSGRRVVLRLGAAESAAYVWVDGEFVGMATDSRLPSEFDVTAHVRAGRRATVAVAVVKWSGGTWVEDQDQWWHGGIQRSVTVHSTARSYLATTWLVPGLRDDLGTGTLDVDVQVDGPARREHGWTVEAAGGGEPAATGGGSPPPAAWRSGCGTVPTRPSPRSTGCSPSPAGLGRSSTSLASSRGRTRCPSATGSRSSCATRPAQWSRPVPAGPGSARSRCATRRCWSTAGRSRSTA